MHKIFSYLLISFISATAFGDEYHYNNLLIGGSSMGFGGAYSALTDDLSVMHYNPAALVKVKQVSTASFNAMSWEKTIFKEVHSNGSDFTRNSFTIVPGFLAVKKEVNNWSLGASFAVTDFSKERQSSDIQYTIPANPNAPATQASEFIYIDMDNNTFKLGASAATQINDQLSFGLSIFIRYSDFKTMQGSGVELLTALPDVDILSGFSASFRMNDTRMDIEPIIGLLWKNEDFSFGVKVAQPISLTRDIDLTATAYAAGPQTLVPNVRPANRLTAQSTKEQKSPFQLTLANAYFFDKITISLNLDYFSKVTEDPFIVDDVVYAVTRNIKKVINLAAGIEYKISAENSVTFSLFTDNSNGKIDTTLPYQRVEDIDLLGVGLSYKNKIKSNEMTFGVYYKFGDGKVRYSDTRAVEQIVGLPLYPNHNNFDISDATKKQLVAYLSLSF